MMTTCPSWCINPARQVSCWVTEVDRAHTAREWPQVPLHGGFGSAIVVLFADEVAPGVLGPLRVRVDAECELPAEEARALGRQLLEAADLADQLDAAGDASASLDEGSR